MAEDYPEKVLITDFLHGSKRAFEELYEQYYEKLYFFSFRMIRNKEEAEDITLDTLNKLFAKHKDFDNLPQVKAFVYITSRNSCFNYLRSVKNQHGRNKRFLDEITDDYQTVNDQLDADFIKAVMLHVEKLPFRSRQVVELYYVKGMKYKEIASHLGITVKSVENQLRFALKKLREALTPGNLTGTWILTCLIFFGGIL